MELHSGNCITLTACKDASTAPEHGVEGYIWHDSQPSWGAAYNKACANCLEKGTPECCGLYTYTLRISDLKLEKQ